MALRQLLTDFPCPVLRPVIGIQPRLSSVGRALPVCVAYVDTRKITVAVVFCLHMCIYTCTSRSVHVHGQIRFHV